MVLSDNRDTVVAKINLINLSYQLRPYKINYLFIIPVRPNFYPASGLIYYYFVNIYVQNIIHILV